MTGYPRLEWSASDRSAVFSLGGRLYSLAPAAGNEGPPREGPAIEGWQLWTGSKLVGEFVARRSDFGAGQESVVWPRILAALALETDLGPNGPVW
jgi:hypothetical protein